MSWIEKIDDTEFENSRIENLPDRPNLGNAYGHPGLSAQGLKEHFDKAAALLREKIDALIDATDPDMYSENIEVGFGEIDTLKKLVASFSDGTFANKLMVDYGVATASLESLIVSIDRAIQGKVDKLSPGDKTQLYAVQSRTGNTIGIELRPTKADAGTIPVYVGNATEPEGSQDGVLFTGTPTKDKHAANKKYVDDVSDRVSAVENGKVNKVTEGNRIYMTAADGSESSLSIKHPRCYDIVSSAAYLKLKEGQTEDDISNMEDIIAFISGKILLAPNTTKDSSIFSAVNKRYVDGLERVIRISYNSTTGKITLTCMDEEGKEKTQIIDLPIEEAFTSAEYDEETNKIIFTTQSGDTVEVPLGKVLGGIITPENLAQDLEGAATDKAVSQAAVKVLKEAHESDFALLADEVYKKVDTEDLYEEWQTSNILDPDNAESGYIETTNGALMDSSNHFRTSTPISVEGHAGYIHIRTRLPNDYTHQNRLICILTYDGDGNALGGATKKVSSQGANGDILFTLKTGTTHIRVWVDGAQSGVSFEDWCISFDELERFVSHGSGNRIKEDDIIITKFPEKSYEPAPRGYVDDGFVKKTNTAWRVYGTGEGAAPREYSLTSKARKTYLAEYADVTGGTEAFDGYLVTCDPENPYHAANKEYVDKGLDGKLDANTIRSYSVYATGAAGVQTMRYLACNGTSDMAIPYYANANNETQFPDDVNPMYTFGVCDPLKPIQAANKRYVDNKIDEMDKSLANLREAAIGTLYNTYEYAQDSYGPIDVPYNALPYIYVESLGEAIFYNENGEEIGIYYTEALTDDAGEVIIQRPYVPCFVQLPAGSGIRLAVNSDPPEATTHTVFRNMKIIFQLKVGA